MVVKILAPDLHFFSWGMHPKTPLLKAAFQDLCLVQDDLLWAKPGTGPWEALDGSFVTYELTIWGNNME